MPDSLSCRILHHRRRVSLRKAQLFAASFNLFSVWLTARTAPDSEISPKTTVRHAANWRHRDGHDRIAAATARSAAGSVTRNPPATFR